MKHLPFSYCLGAFLFCGVSVQAQWLGTNPEALAPASQGVVVGTGGGTPSALTVQGGQVTPSTGEVFRTYSNGLADTFWRMHKSSVEVGNIHARNSGSEHWYLNAVPGDLRFQTATSDRGMFNRVLGSASIGGVTGLNLTGYFGVGPFSGPDYQYAASKVHIDRSGSNTVGYRAAMGEGLLVTSGAGLLYTGMFGAGGADLGLAWSSGSAPLRFVNTGGTGATGLEFARFQPDGGVTQGYFGIGNWPILGFVPDERLDVGSGAVKVRDLPTNTYQANTLTKVLVVDDVAPNIGKLKWRDASTLGGCDWQVTAADHVVTAYQLGPLTGCPDQSNNVGIGTNIPAAKLEVVRVTNSGGVTSTGFDLLMSTTSTNNVGGTAKVQTPAAGQNTGWQANTSNGGLNWGLDGNAAVNNLGNSVLWGGVRIVGVRGFADGNGGTPKPNVRGVWGVAIGALNAAGAPTMGYAGWFDGDVNIQGGSLFLNQVFAISDASVKTNVEDLENAGDLIGQLSPKTYFFDTLVHTELGLPGSLQRGLLAPDVELVLPELVTEVQHEARYDSLGNEVSAAYTLKAVNYIGFIPLLLSNAKEQQVLITQQNARIDALELQVAQCCATVPADNRGMTQTMSNGSLETDLRIIPNPVAANTQLRYTLATGGLVRLEVTDNSGRVVEVLETATRTSGSFTYDWNTTQLATGTYYCALYLNDERLVQKAVKLNER
jgi:hypothetical protein